MQPIRIYIKDFCSHAKTEFSFTDFSSALILGKVRDNDRFSNGAGKSTIFNAIEYALFNEVRFSSLEKSIRDGCDVCCVEFEFLSSLDKCVYKIVRSNSRKTGTDVRLFKKNQDSWIDQTQRRVTDTEEEIFKIVGFNYKAFCASAVFGQAGSENNIQKNYSNLPSLTAEKRKSVLREVLQLNSYINYEKLAKNKFNQIEQELQKIKFIIETIGNPISELNILSLSKNELFATLNDKILEHETSKRELVKIEADYLDLINKISLFNNKIELKELTKNNLVNEINNDERFISETQLKVNKATAEIKSLVIKLNEYKQQLCSSLQNKVDDSSLDEELFKKQQIFNDKLLCIKELKSNLSKLNNSFIKDSYCEYCHQNIPEEHKQNWCRSLDLEIKTTQTALTQLENEHRDIFSSIKLIEKKIKENSLNNKYISNIQFQIEILNKDLENTNNIVNNHNSTLEERSSILNNKRHELTQALKDLSLLSSEAENKKLTANLDFFKKKISSLNNSKQVSSNEIRDLTAKIAVLDHQIGKCKENIDKIEIYSKRIVELEKSMIIHSRVVQAFGSNGIPAIITKNVLGELQVESNNWLAKLRPGLQLQFIIDNDDKERTDALDILYFIDGSEREYRQLSGAQKIIISLAIKLGLIFIMNKRLGVEIKLMLLDEVDQALDDGGTEVFAEIIKILQKELKILVITHNNNLKHKFSHTILVEQDENNISRAKLLN